MLLSLRPFSVYSVCYLAGMFIENIRHKQPELGIDNREVLCVKIAGLCHDMGHGPFSHLFQDLFMPKMKPKTKWRVSMLSHLDRAGILTYY